MKIFSLKKILEKLENSIKKKKPFSLIRFGDGGIKFLHCILYNDEKQMKEISKREGIPIDKFLDVFELWGKYARHADFIDTPEVYFTDQFWPRTRKHLSPPSPKTVERLKLWKDLYSRAEFDNTNFCNPEINYLSCIQFKNQKNLIDIISNKRICCITTNSELPKKVKFSDFTVFKIVGQYEGHYEKCYSETISYIHKNATNFDLWLVAAGELGRVYTGLIKELGGRSFDIGFMIDYWNGTKELHPRLQFFLLPIHNNRYELRLSSFGKKYLPYI